MRLGYSWVGGWWARRALCAWLVAVVGLMAWVVPSAVAVEPASHLTIQALQFPTHFTGAEEAGCKSLWKR
jgi:hypothetical protein